MNDKDRLMLEQLYEEGVYDRMKARIAGVGGSVRGIGHTVAGGATQLAGTARKGFGNAGQKIASTIGQKGGINIHTQRGAKMIEAGQARQNAAKTIGVNAKHESIINSTIKNTSKDLSLTGVVDKQQLNSFEQEFRNLINKYASGGSQVPPPLS